MLGAQKSVSALRAKSELSAICQNRVWGQTSYGSSAGSPPVLPQDRHLNLKDAAPGLLLDSNLLFEWQVYACSPEAKSIPQPDKTEQLNAISSCPKWAAHFWASWAGASVLHKWQNTVSDPIAKYPGCCRVTSSSLWCAPKGLETCH